MRRRAFISICGCVFGAAFRTARAWPTPAGDNECAGSEILDIQSAGCSLSATKGQATLSKISYTYTLEDKALADGFLNTQMVMERIYGVKPSLFFFTEEAPNALAFPTSIDGDCEVTGSIIFGTKLLSTEMENNPSMWGSALSIILAHEYAHILQYKRRLDTESFRRELHADYLSGWAVAKMNIAGICCGIDPNVAARTLYSKGGYDFNNKDFHGTPEQRSSMMAEGYNSAFTGVGLDQAFQAGLDVVSVVRRGSE